VEEAGLFAGTNQIRFHAIGPAGGIARIEVLNEAGQVIAASTPRTGVNWEAVDPRAGIAMVSISLNVIPSRNNPLPKDDVIRMARDELKQLSGNKPDLLELPSGWHTMRSSMRLVYVDGVQTDSVPIRVE
jgi:hypothetical protein